jgi:hypothetical protein
MIGHVNTFERYQLTRYKMSKTRTLFWMASLVFIVVITGFVGCRYRHDITFLAGSTVATSIITFFGFLILGAGADQGRPLNERNLRFAIAGSVVITYLVVVGMGIFFIKASEMPEIASSLLTSFTSIVGVVVAFYFGASAYTEMRTKDAEKKKQDKSV